MNVPAPQYAVSEAHQEQLQVLFAQLGEIYWAIMDEQFPIGSKAIPPLSMNTLLTKENVPQRNLQLTVHIERTQARG